MYRNIFFKFNTLYKLFNWNIFRIYQYLFNFRLFWHLDYIKSVLYIKRVLYIKSVLFVNYIYHNVFFNFLSFLKILYKLKKSLFFKYQIYPTRSILTTWINTVSRRIIFINNLLFTFTHIIGFKCYLDILSWHFYYFLLLLILLLLFYYIMYN